MVIELGFLIVGVYNQLGPGLSSGHNKVLERIALDTSEHLEPLTSLKYNFIEVDSVDEKDKGTYSFAYTGIKAYVFAITYIYSLGKFIPKKLYPNSPNIR
jgi:hypothetical protein